MRGELISMETLKIMKAIEIENKDLQERIDNAIEYIKSLEGDYDLELANCVEYELFQILKGEKK